MDEKRISTTEESSNATRSPTRSADPRDTSIACESLPGRAQLNREVAGKLGVLFVHGIGEQKEGDTLTAFAEPILWWMREAIRGHGQRSVSEPYSAAEVSALEFLGTPPDGIVVQYASLLPSRRMSASPAHALVEVRVSQSGHQQCQQWVFAESWWGEQVQPPPVFELIGWLFSRAPWIALIHVAERARRAAPPISGRGGKVTRALSGIFLALVVWPRAVISFLASAIISQGLLTVAWFVALIPISVFRRYLSVVLQKMTFIIGDSYGLVANETQRAAILTRFRSTVEWLQDHCEKVVIVAHSQGSAVVSEAIKAGIIAHPPLLLTFGSGVTKLSQLRMCEVAHAGKLSAAGWIIPSMLGATLSWVAMTQAMEGRLLLFVVIALYVVSAACALAAWSAWSRTREYPSPPGTLRGDYHHRWIDLYATHDPVPQGPLENHFPGCGISSEPVVNRRSVITDHTTYWSNKTEFVSRIGGELCEAAGLKGMPDLAGADYRSALRHHRFTISALSLTLWTIIASVVAVGFFRFDYLAQLGKKVIDAVNFGPFTSVAAYLRGAGQAAAWLLLDVKATAPARYDSVVQASAAILVLLLIAYLWWHIVVALLSKWDAVLITDFLDRSNTWGRYGTWMVWPFIGLFLLTPLALAYAISLHGDPLLIVRVAAALLALLVALALLAGIYGAIPKDRRQLKRVSLKALAVLARATRPGSDDKTSGRRGWRSWKLFFECCLLMSIAAAVLGFAAERLLGLQTTSIWFVVALYGTASVLMPIRSARLIMQRRHNAWFAWGVALIPLAIGMFAATILHWDISRLVSIALVMVLAIPLWYVAIDWLLPLRGTPGGQPESAR